MTDENERQRQGHHASHNGHGTLLFRSLLVAHEGDGRQRACGWQRLLASWESIRLDNVGDDVEGLVLAERAGRIFRHGGLNPREKRVETLAVPIREERLAP